jgi:hypothetical protein
MTSPDHTSTASAQTASAAQPHPPAPRGPVEAGGLSSRELLAMRRALAGTNVVGADIVEVAPAYDHAKITGIAAAHVGYELLARNRLARASGGAR